jgi:hypothetical protein
VQDRAGQSHEGQSVIGGDRGRRGEAGRKSCMDPGGEQASERHTCPEKKSGPGFHMQHPQQIRQKFMRLPCYM